MELKKKQEQRLKYLEVLYKKAAGTPLQGVNHYEIAQQAGLSPECAKRAFYFLQGEGLIHAQSPDGLVNITHQGVKAYEAILSNSQAPFTTLLDSVTTAFPGLPGYIENQQIDSSPLACQARNTRLAPEHWRKAAIRKLKAALTSSLLESGVRFLLSLVKRWW